MIARVAGELDRQSVEFARPVCKAGDPRRNDDARGRDRLAVIQHDAESATIIGLDTVDAARIDLQRGALAERVTVCDELSERHGSGDRDTARTLVLVERQC